MSGDQIMWMVVSVVSLLAAVGVMTYALRRHLTNQWIALAWAVACTGLLVLAFVAGGQAIYA